ncbi:unnamed protein product [Heligmosomoides polygyrus]|uniref:CPG4 domain-containing protein n=1 Tax=Heligmosomoides polygyrus TaxID=6339 RepID=A0A3P7ZCL5_HELPZ|nr:unnamed protein product [Heligmosomoides polygyrus]
MWPAVLLLTTVVVTAEMDECERRCQRIQERSLARVGFDDEKLRQLLEKQRPLGTMKDICWRAYDHLDCMKQCGSSPEHEKFAKFVQSKCHFALKGMESALSCVSRYHSFMEVRCSTFLNEASQLKAKQDPTMTPSQQICRFLHLNTLCLENTVTMYCANAKKVFRRLNFRDYFPNFILPSNDTLFDDIDLDACQMFDFVKKNTKFSESQMDKELTTVLNFLEAKNVATRPMIPTTPATISKERKEFTSLLEELLEDSTSAPEVTAKETTTSSTGALLTPPSKLMLSETTTTPKPTTTPKKSKKQSSVVTKTTKPLKATPATSTTTDSTIRSTHPSHREDDRYDEYDDDGVVDVVPIQNAKDPTHNVTTVEPDFSPSSKSRVFSDDSWEFTPPNFRYSSMRFGNGGVTPLNIDTTTLFGMDDDSAEESGENEDQTALENTAYPKEHEGNDWKTRDEVKADTVAPTETSAKIMKQPPPPTDSKNVILKAMPHGQQKEEPSNVDLPSSTGTVTEVKLSQEGLEPVVGSNKEPTVSADTSEGSNYGHVSLPGSIAVEQTKTEDQERQQEQLPSLQLKPNEEPRATRTEDLAFSKTRGSTLRTSSQASMTKPKRPKIPFEK